MEHVVELVVAGSLHAEEAVGHVKTSVLHRMRRIDVGHVVMLVVAALHSEEPVGQMTPSVLHHMRRIAIGLAAD